MPGGNKFFRGGPIISEKLVPGGTNFRGVQIKRDRLTLVYGSMRKITENVLKFAMEYGN